MARKTLAILSCSLGMMFAVHKASAISSASEHVVVNIKNSGFICTGMGCQLLQRNFLQVVEAFQHREESFMFLKRIRII
jgi:hypothetical protein